MAYRNYYWNNLNNSKITQQLIKDCYATWFNEAKIFHNLKIYLYARKQQPVIKEKIKQALTDNNK